MNSTPSRPKKSPSSKVRKVGRVTPRARGAALSALRREFRAWQASLPTALERDTLLMPEVIAESVCAEASHFLGEEMPARYVTWLAAKAELCYSARRRFYRTLRGSGNGPRDWLRAFMRHWLDSLLALERPDLHRCLPVEFGNGHRLPSGLHPRINRRGFIRDLLPAARGWDALRVTRYFRWAWLATLETGKGHAPKRRHRHRPGN